MQHIKLALLYYYTVLQPYTIYYDELRKVERRQLGWWPIHVHEAQQDTEIIIDVPTMHYA